MKKQGEGTREIAEEQSRGENVLASLRNFIARFCYFLESALAPEQNIDKH